MDAVRLSSLSKWPVTSSQSPLLLCDAGFFYAGFSDCVRCHSCGGGLRNWEAGDIPWIEHARWYPTCDYLRRCKGELFINMHRQDGAVPPPITTVQSQGQFRAENSEREMAQQIARASREDDDIAVRSVLEMGYSKTVVNSAVELLRKRGKASYTATDIMQIILEKEDGGDETEKENIYHSPQNMASGASNASADSASLIKENRNLKEQMTCKICFEKEAVIVFLPCGHMVTCPNCAPTIRKCCICRQLIQGTVRAYL